MSSYATIADLTDDRVLYRDLEPIDPTLPGLRALAPELGLAPGQLPRKRDDGYARVVLRIAEAAQRQRGAQVGALIVLGDTENDRRLGLGLEQIGVAPALTFLGLDAPERPATLEWQGSIAYATRWALIDTFLEEAAARGAPAGRHLVVIADIDKTLLGPRGRADMGIDEGRVEAAEQTAADLLGNTLDTLAFRGIYRELCGSSYHAFTLDNQDIVAYTALLVATGACNLGQIQNWPSDGTITSFRALLDKQAATVVTALAPTHQDIRAALDAGDPTPFKQFRHHEFAATVRRMTNGTLPLCAELFTALVRLNHAGALCMAASDKPAEASLPTPAQYEAGLLPLHRTPALLG